MTPPSEAVVQAFLADVNTSYDQVVAAYRRHLTEDVAWHTGTELCHGIDECVAHLSRAAEHGISHWEAEVLLQGSKGDVVFNERVDHIYRVDGSKLAETTVCAVFEVEGDRIARWRDYYDPTALRELIADEAAARSNTA
jgi:limonene-1,2-epoxide hydrolase